jgi:tetratricopeptide (TPR) repeat protein
MESEELHFNLGYVYRVSGNPDKALEELGKVVALNPRHPYAHGELARIHTAQDRIDDAIHEFRIDIEISPDRFFSRYDLGLLYKKEQHLMAARESLEKAAMLDPDYPHTREKLREVYKSIDIAENRIPHQIKSICDFGTQTP